VKPCAREIVTESPPRKETVCAVYVTYHPDAKFPERVARIVPQVAHIIIVDNNSNEEAVRMLRVVCASRNFDLIENNDNLGVATALNQGAGRAIEFGYTWALTMDQDSWPQVDLVAKLAEIYTTHPNRDRVKIIGSNYRSPVTGYIALDCRDTGRAYTEVEAVITSCSLTCLKTFEEVGKFRDDLFIDQVDDEYCLRIRSFGYKVIISCEPLMTHSPGNETSHKILVKRPVCTNHSPLRRYYITRNRLVLFGRYLLKEPIWIKNRSREALTEIILILLFEKQKAQKIEAIMLGVFHAIIGKMGRLRNRSLERHSHESISRNVYL
jgi:rhamnosyltransferase